ncbi:benzoate 4-monooxygenase cytochrome p450 [Grosmannia clavigera kw1407]|uniref:Benzoate 4-monooxygenase cytochrome p450 n=1 Tax=Grosmannia clavigera (strain kw1407 / UAMH 11150) TaxID=655863 RepID=F0XFI7_GROCL|nr:benzoate 4-monooxygenase cytochrome p450 [Grosmannia clavigera kw1407]EFX04330.1 benzoate 4-monooxygenase cytochrome p450 [Grosmannia clavigera kw1407]
MALQAIFWLADSACVPGALVLGVAIVIYTAVAWFASWARLKHIPGPPGVGLSKWWLLRNSLHGSLYLANMDACKTYGKCRAVDGRVLVTDDPDVLRHIWAVRSPYKKGPFYEAVRFNPERDNLVSLRDDRAHGTLRAKMAAGYAGKENESLESSIDREILAFVDLLERKYISTKTDFRPVDLAHKAQYLTLDVITALAFGKRLGFSEQDRDLYSYIKMTEENMPVMMLMTIFPQLAHLMQSRLFRWMMPSERDRVGFGAFIAVAKEIVSERLASDNPYQKDMLGSFLAHGLTREEAEGETLLQIIAGSDTTATAIRSTMLHLMSSPRSYHRLATEVREASAQGRISSPITYAEARAMLYLQAVIQEGLRINPPVVGTMDVVVPEGGDVLCGLRVPAGAEVGCSMFSLQRQTAIFGADADVFRPERWLEADEDVLKEMASTWSLIFRYGKWRCLGKDVALLELNKVFVELLRRYDFTLVNPAKPWDSTNAGIFIQSNMYTKVTRVESVNV